MTTSRVMTMLTERVPITLICDLVSVVDPDSTAINSAERPDTIWLDRADPRSVAESTDRNAVSA
jgi:hypothetical protein